MQLPENGIATREKAKARPSHRTIAGPRKNWNQVDRVTRSLFLYVDLIL
jgi:hypothetical protein